MASGGPSAPFIQQHAVERAAEQRLGLVAPGRMKLQKDAARAWANIDGLNGLFAQQQRPQTRGDAGSPEQMAALPALAARN